MSDTHDFIPNIRKAVDLFNAKGVARCLHAGDIYTARSWQAFQDLRCPIDFVFGNGDDVREPLQEAAAGRASFHERRFDVRIEGRRLLMMHEPESFDDIANVSDYDCIIYGHTHRHDIREAGGILLINPGEVCGYVTGIASVVILELPTLKAELIDLETGAVI